MSELIERTLRAIVAEGLEDAASDENATGWGCYLVLKLGGTYVVRLEPVLGTGRDRVRAEWYATEAEGWDRFNALCALD